MNAWLTIKMTSQQHILLIKKLYVQFKKKHFATQFHPEKSDFDGLDMLKSF